MAILGLDLGGTKLATAVFSTTGVLSDKKVILLEGRQGKEVGQLIKDQIQEYLSNSNISIQSIGISVPGISRSKSGTVWAPNIRGWDDYPLLEDIKSISKGTPVIIDSDRACCIMGEVWQGNAKGCMDAIYLTIGTGIGAGIICDGKILRGSHDIAGAIGWMALQKPFDIKYTSCGNFEYFASGEGIVNLAKKIIHAHPEVSTILSKESYSSHTIFSAYQEQDSIAIKIIPECIMYWGMACANLISIFNPEKIIFGGGLFGPAIPFIQDIRVEAAKWTQPISITQVSFEASGLPNDTALYGAAYLALNHLSSP